MRILLPVDGSDCALRAVDQAIVLQGEWRACQQIHLLHVHPPIPLGRVQAHIGPETLRAYYQEEGEALLLPALERLTTAGVAVESHVHVGQPAEVIVKLADTLDCRLILMGTQGRGTLLGAMMGSVTRRVLHLSTRPVLLVK